MSIEFRNPSTLQPHPKQEDIYDSIEVDLDLKESILANGVLEALTITEEGIIVSGHRRWAAAVALDLPSVPVQVRQYESEEQMLVHLIEANRQRVKKPSQQWREMEATSDALSREAKVRKAKGVPTSFPDENEGRVAELIAERFGISTRRYNDLQTVYGVRYASSVTRDLEAKGLKSFSPLSMRWDEIGEQLDEGAISLSKAAELVRDAIILAEESIPGRLKKRPAPKGRPKQPPVLDWRPSVRQVESSEDTGLMEPHAGPNGTMLMRGLINTEEGLHPAVVIDGRAYIFPWEKALDYVVELDSKTSAVPA